MKKITLDGHSFDEDLINSGWILDAGCRGFGSFTDYFLEKNCKILALDPDEKIIPPVHENLFFRKEGLWYSDDIKTYSGWSYGEGNMVHENNEYTTENYNYMNKSSVQCHTIEWYMKELTIDQFDLIKLDIEGCEFSILENYIRNKKILAKQFSIEFHEFIGRNEAKTFDWNLIYGGWFAENYKIIQHEKGKLDNYWDSLFILK